MPSMTVAGFPTIQKLQPWPQRREPDMQMQAYSQTRPLAVFDSNLVAPCLQIWVQVCSTLCSHLAGKILKEWGGCMLSRHTSLFEPLPCHQRFQIGKWSICPRTSPCQKQWKDSWARKGHAQIPVPIGQGGPFYQIALPKPPPPPPTSRHGPPGLQVLVHAWQFQFWGSVNLTVLANQGLYFHAC